MSKMRKQVTVTLTVKEAVALHSAAGQILDFEDATDAHFQDRTMIKPALRAWDKLLDAYAPIYYRTEPASIGKVKRS
ncbi:MAG: hypothetical protein Unbinned2819contig1003_22 [Prokaryotic dsDNA virus sp.]|nr:MAG: hypothetical protein Unbinned2819contig1003_22 [Prokaryotic dsDNA virus sp.]|tara:strand:- start:5505 stop:5735 length:231 start_codon:yes stop_codon:yes gene_type:complete